MIISFHATFVPLIQSGAKRRTIRQRAPRVGQRLHPYTGPYRPGQRLPVIPPVICTAVTPVTIYQGCVEVAGVTLTTAETAAFARADGFPGPAEFFRYFGRKKFRGYLIEW